MKSVYVSRRTVLATALVTLLSASPALAQQVSIHVWGGVPPESGPQALIDEFSTLHPDIKVTYTRFVNDPAGNLKLDTALQGGAPIDVFFSYFPDVLAKRVNAGLATDLTERVSADAELQSLNSPEISPFIDGKLFAIPTNVAPGFVFVNKDMLEAAGIDVPQDWTVDEFREIAKQLTQGEVHGAFRAPLVAVPTLGQDATFNAAGEANFTDPAWRAEAELWAGMAAEGSTFPEDQIISQQLGAYAQNAFLGGRVGLWVTDGFNFRFTNNVAEYPRDFTISFAPLPKPVGVDTPWNSGSYDNYVSISEKSPNKEAAWTFVKFWLTEGADNLLPTGKLSPLALGDVDTVTAGMLGENPTERYDVGAFERVFFDDSIRLGVPTVFRGLAEIVAAKASLTSQLKLGELTVDQWVEQMQERATAAIAKDL